MVAQSGDLLGSNRLNFYYDYEAHGTAKSQQKSTDGLFFTSDDTFAATTSSNSGYFQYVSSRFDFESGLYLSGGLNYDPENGRMLGKPGDIFDDVFGNGYNGGKLYKDPPKINSGGGGVTNPATKKPGLILFVCRLLNISEYHVFNSNVKVNELIHLGLKIEHCFVLVQKQEGSNHMLVSAAAEGSNYGIVSDFLGQTTNKLAGNTFIKRKKTGAFVKTTSHSGETLSNANKSDLTVANKYESKFPNIYNKTHDWVNVSGISQWKKVTKKWNTKKNLGRGMHGLTWKGCLKGWKRIQPTNTVLSKMKLTAANMNSKKATYDFRGPNSNSFAYSLFKSAGCDDIKTEHLMGAKVAVK